MAPLIGFSSQQFTELKVVSKSNETVKAYLKNGLEGCQVTFTLEINLFEKFKSEIQVCLLRLIYKLCFLTAEKMKFLTNFYTSYTSYITLT